MPLFWLIIHIFIFFLISFEIFNLFQSFSIIFRISFVGPEWKSLKFPISLLKVQLLNFYFFWKPFYFALTRWIRKELKKRQIIFSRKSFSFFKHNIENVGNRKILRLSLLSNCDIKDFIMKTNLLLLIPCFILLEV